MIIPLDGELLQVCGRRSFLLVARAGSLFALRIQAPGGEYCQTIEPSDLIVVSAPEGGALEPAIMLAEFVRKYRMPLIVLPRDHPGAQGASYLVSAGPVVTTSCSIRRGTHPEQHLVCACDELAGITLTACPEGVEMTGLPAGAVHRYVHYHTRTEFSTA